MSKNNNSHSTNSNGIKSNSHSTNSNTTKVVNNSQQHNGGASVNISIDALSIANAMVGIANSVVANAEYLIDERNKIWVQLNQSSYIGGDVVSGTVEMDCIVPFFAKGVIVKFKGFERIWLQELYTVTTGEGDKQKSVNKIRDHKENKEFFKSTIVVNPQSGVVNIGHYSFPFSYKLPEKLPGTFCHDGKDSDGAYSAKILYKCKATVDVTHKHSLKSTTKLVVNEKCDTLVKPSFSENKKSFMFTPGELEVKTWLDKNAYFPGETLVAKIKANNTSLKPTRKILINVYHRMYFETRNYNRRITDYIHKKEYDGFEPCYYGKRYLPFSIPVKLKPSSYLGKHITSRYILEVECDIPGATDLSVELPLKLFAPQYLYGELPAQPPGAPLPPNVSYRQSWELDEHASNCRKCNKSFGLFVRKHHCRHCNKIFCDSCTPSECNIPKLAYSKPVRVCVDCHPIASKGGQKFQSAKSFAPQYQATLNDYYSKHPELRRQDAIQQ